MTESQLNQQPRQAMAGVENHQAHAHQNHHHYVQQHHAPPPSNYYVQHYAQHPGYSMLQNSPALDDTQSHPSSLQSSPPPSHSSTHSLPYMVSHVGQQQPAAYQSLPQHYTTSTSAAAAHLQQQQQHGFHRQPSTGTHLPPSNHSTGGSSALLPLTMHPAVHNGAQQGNAAGMIPGFNRILKVSAKSLVKNTAGSIAHTSRAGECPMLMATGPASINQAIKAICIARGYVEENQIDLVVRTEFRDEIRMAINFVLLKRPPSLSRPSSNTIAQPGTVSSKTSASDNGAISEPRSTQQSDKQAVEGLTEALNDTSLADSYELRVAQGSEPSIVAGSIAKKLRMGERVNIVSIGAGSVSGSVRAITIARRYLERDSIDVTFRPEFIHVDMQDGTRSAIRFNILATHL